MGKPVMISVSGIRGIVGEGLTPELLTNYSAAVGTLYGKGRVMVGRDSRVTGEMVKSAVFSGLMSVGCDPVDLGVCSTPTVQFAVQESDAVGGIVITASHNPVNWNALKLLSSHGLFLDQAQGAQVKEIVEKKMFKFAGWDKIGKVNQYKKAIADHIQAVLTIPYLDLKGLRKQHFRIGYDCVNGAGGTILPQLFEALGCEIFPINEEPNGLFAHTPEPVPQNLKELCQHVKNKNVDIGFAVDPDVDRLAIVTENGDPIGEEYTVTLAAKYILSQKKGQVVVNLSTTRAVEDVANEAGVSLHRTKVGEIYVAKKMKETGAVIGGEGNGGVLLPEVHLGRDAPVAIALTLQHLLESGKSISQLWKSLPQYVMTKKKIDIGENDPDTIMKRLIHMHESENVDLQDGLRIDRPEGWVHIRKSNTEPIIRVMSEASTSKGSEQLCNQFLDIIRKEQSVH